ncbi:MAG TPA: sigma-54 dependent transcriptional regulator [Oligoflexus sp.]|uniref:sigma-54-dependent transcriptional regulator n=1 Tax=Oligoflexus sp. TaxID=1971216 RepID=UPI002D32AB22|nr:sigma-54 dependent transcriptional regulator [Oligoflexus sp.]HYX37091.1 sigma-54 dependent transcriptional regulator [Oligoflexus sp.]
MSKGKFPRHALNGTRILIIDDEEILAWSIETELKSHGAEVLSCNTLRTALESFSGFNPDLAICDLRLPDGSGMELLKKWRSEKPDMPIILITAHGAVESAVDALRLGAFDYLQKPFDLKVLVAAVNRGAELSLLRQKVSQLTGHEAVREPLQMVGESPAMKRVRTQLERIARSKASSVLILGESGTGKELAACALHEWSDRANQPFVEINCASIPENLLESELFGYEKGAFTDARDRKLGLFELAQNGTIFLDEIGEMPMKLQTKLLRALEYRRFKRLGGTKDISFSARIVAATNRNLLEEIQLKTFRSDLYYRLSALPVYLPPLRERMEDLDRMAEFFVMRMAHDLGIAGPSLGVSAREKLRSHSWPGNMRELKNILERALVFHAPSEIQAQHIELDVMQEPLSHAMPQGDPVSMVLPAQGINLDELERDLLLQALERAHNNQTKAADLLGISRHTFRYRLEKYGLKH